jgi:hypothetical protein
VNPEIVRHERDNQQATFNFQTLQNEKLELIKKKKKTWDSYFIHAPIFSPSSPFGKTRQRL